MPSLLEVEDPRAHFFMRDATIKAVDGVSFQIPLRDRKRDLGFMTLMIPHDLRLSYI